MKTEMKFARVVIVVLVLAQVAWFVLPRSDSLMANPYRNHERIAAFRQNAQMPSAVTKMAVDQEMRLLSQHVRNHNLTVLAFSLVIDSILILLLWNCTPSPKDHSTLNVVPKRS